MSTIKANTVKPISTTNNLEIQTNDTTRMTLSATDGLIKLPTSSPGIQYGDGYIQQFAGGKIRQVVTAVQDSPNTSTSTSLVDSGIQATITPKSASSCIYVDAMVSAGGGINNTMGFGIKRGSTNIALGIAGNNRRQATAGCFIVDNEAVDATPIKFFDNPNTTSEVTYTVTFSVRSGYTGYINRSSNDSDAQEYIRPISTITLMEVATGA
tara:strand:- start:9893 stop:10525 length:633 start_codon:yes stop_codon:yes gene_type:complete